MIHQELTAHLEEIIHHDKQDPPFNNILGSFPTTLAYLLQSVLANYFPDFDRGIWLDDVRFSRIEGGNKNQSLYSRYLRNG